ncbi:KilA-N domain-containing protein [Brucellaceae bacterium D45D]
MPEMKVMLFKKSKIRVDDNGLVCLSDIHTAAGFSKNQGPSDYMALPSAQKEVTALIKKKTGKSGLFSKEDITSVWYSKKGPGGGVWADENIALGYSAYLSPNLAIEIRDVFLRYKKADPTLADEVLEKASPEANEWAATRALARVKRNEFTATLQNHGVEKFGYGQCTDAVYNELFDARAKQMKISRGLAKNDNLRNAMSTDELVSVMFAETLSRQRIEEENPHGNSQCYQATKRSSKIVRQAIDTDRKDRQRALIK